MTIHVTITGPVHIHQIDPDLIVQPILAALATTQGAVMSDVDAALATITSEFDTFRADLARELADFGNLIAGHLTTEQQTAFQALTDKFTEATAAVDAADPVPAPPVV